MPRVIKVCVCHSLVLNGDGNCRVTDQPCGIDFCWDEDRAKERKL